MKRRIFALPLAAVVVSLLAGCATGFESSDSGPQDLSKPSVIASYCGTNATDTANTITELANAKSDSGQRNTLTQWGYTDVMNDKTIKKDVAATVSTLTERAKVSCDNPTSSPSPTSTASTAADTGKEKAEYTDAQLAAIVKAMNAHKGDGIYSCKVDSTYHVVSFNVASKLPVSDDAKDRKWSDAISTRLAATDPVKAKEELQAAICVDPILGSTYAKFLATTVRTQLLNATGVDLLKDNPELNEFATGKVSDLAAKYDPLEFIKDPTAKQITAAIDTNMDWQDAMSVVGTLLDRFKVSAIDTRKSVVNYHLSDYAVGVHKFAEVGINPKQENLPALIFTITEKGQCGEITSFGANTDDKRPELFAAKNCETPKETTPGKPSTNKPTTGCTSNCTTTTTPGCTSNCGTTTTPKCPSGYTGTPPNCLLSKKATDDVAAPQGTTKQGSGAVQPAPTKKADPVDPGTPKTADPGKAAPVKGASPAPSSSPAPVVSQAPVATDPGTGSKDPDG